MTWIILPFGKHKGDSLPQALLKDPNWFFWILPKLYGLFRKQAEELAQKARAIKIPKHNPKKWRVEYWTKNDKNFGRVSLVKVGSDQNLKWAVRKRHLDLSWLRDREAHIERGDGKLIDSFRRLYFGGRKLSKKRCEAFFENDDNFVQSPRRDP
jgi:hypothetical protein